MTRTRTAIVALAGAVTLAGATAQAADATTIHLLSRSIPSAGGLFDPNGNPLPGNAQPSAGSYFIGADNDFKGNHRRHSKRPIGWDHLLCTIVDPATFTVNCDAQLALPRGLIIADRQTVSFSAKKQVFKITGGTGKYRHAKGGTVTSRSTGNSNDTDLVIRY
ncbi:MAG: hypothetical protein QOK21_4229 [Solirubrobacteraceae bacterium]|nr:hypothetical protein [Solirubrobacteraceae bacterium]